MPRRWLDFRIVSALAGVIKVWLIGKRAFAGKASTIHPPLEGGSKSLSSLCEKRFRGGVTTWRWTPPRTLSLCSFVRPSLKGRVNSRSRGGLILAQPVERALQDVSRGHFVDAFGAAPARGIGVNQRARHRRGREPLVPQQYRQ